MIELNKIEKFASYLNRAKSVALICHISPDSDTLCSALALKRMFEKLGKRAEVFCDDTPSDKLMFLPFMDLVNTSKEKVFDVAIAVDCADISRLGVSNKYFQKSAVKLSVDHHKSNTNFADYTLCDSNASATAELVYHIVRFLEKTKNIEILDNEIAMLIFSAIVGDSGAFSFSNTSAETFLIASQLKAFDFDSADIVFRLIKSQSVKSFKLKSRVLNNAKFYEDNRICIITFSDDDYKETATTHEYTEGVISEIINIDSVDIAISVAKVYDKYYKVSIRTKEPYDASECANFFGGGGHERASGCRLSGFYEDIIEKLLKVSSDMLL